MPSFAPKQESQEKVNEKLCVTPQQPKRVFVFNAFFFVTFIDIVTVAYCNAGLQPEVKRSATFEPPVTSSTTEGQNS